MRSGVAVSVRFVATIECVTGGSLGPSVFFVLRPMIDTSDRRHKVPQRLRHFKANRCRGLHKPNAAAAMLISERDL